MIGKYKIALAHFEKIANSETQNWFGLEWIGEISNCDVCCRPMEYEKYMIDGPSSRQMDSPWGNLCVVCALKYSPNIGWGSAQLYKNSTKGNWKLISGGPQEEIYD